MDVHPVKTQISLGIRPVWSVFAVRKKKAWVLSYPLSAQRRLWWDWADAQAELSLHSADSHFVDFDMRRFISQTWTDKTMWIKQHQELTILKQLAACSSNPTRPFSVKYIPVQIPSSSGETISSEMALSSNTFRVMFWKKNTDIQIMCWSTTKPTEWPVNPVETQISLGICYV